jgi:RHS repeat-associated protein
VAFRLDLDGSVGFTDAETFFPLADQRHATVALVDATGAVAARVAYDAFGAATMLHANGTPQAGVPPGGVPLFTGRHWLPEAGLYDYRHRHYDPAAGRFTTRDPVYDPANLGHPYAYVGNNPHGFVDPYGDVAEILWDAASLGLGAASLAYNVGQGNYLGAAVDAVGVGLDTAALVLPFVPGGAGVALKAHRAADAALNAGQATATGIDAGTAAVEGDYAGAALHATGAALQGAHAGVRAGQLRSARPTITPHADAVENMRRGREFDKARESAYPFREVLVEGTGGRRHRLDSYNPYLGEIVSRKHTQLADITEKSAKGYIAELTQKYPRGAAIADVPSNRAEGIAGEQLRGQYFLEVPVQRTPVPQAVLEYATSRGVFIRDITGRRYN